MSRSLTTFLLVASTCSSAVAQEPEVLLAVGEEVPGLPGTELLVVGNPAVNGPGDWAVNIVYDDGGNQVHAIYGGGPTDGGAVVRTQGTFGDLQQDSLGGVAIDDAGRILYVATCTDTSTSTSTLYSLWIDDAPLAVRNDPTVSIPDDEWLLFRFQKMTRSGIPHWNAQYQSAPGPVASGEGGFAGERNSALFKSGDSVPNLPNTLLNQPASDDTVKSSFQLSATGVHSIAGVATNPVNNPRTYVVLDGAGMLVEGRLLGTNQFLPSSWAIQPNERWDVLGFNLGITDDGYYMLGGSTNASTSVDDVLVVNGDVFIRQSDVVDGVELGAPLRRAVMTEEKDVTFIWRFDDDSVPVDPYGFFYNGRLVLRDDDTVDIDGDGTDDAVIGELWWTGHAIDASRRVYVNANVATSGVALALMRVAVEDLHADVDTLSVSAGGTVDLRLLAPRDVPGTHYALVTEVGGGPKTPPTSLRVPGNAGFVLGGVAPKGGLAGTSMTVAALDGLDSARERFLLPAASPAGLAGKTLTFWFAKLESTERGFQSTFVSNPVHVALTP